MLFSNAQRIPNNAQEVHAIIPTTLPIMLIDKCESTIIMLIKTDNMGHEETTLHYHRVQPFQFYMCLDLKVGTSVVTKVILAIVCPKILKIMPVDAYNATTILKCLHIPIMLKIMPT